MMLNIIFYIPRERVIFCNTSLLEKSLGYSINFGMKVNFNDIKSYETK